MSHFTTLRAKRATFIFSTIERLFLAFFMQWRQCWVNLKTFHISEVKRSILMLSINSTEYILMSIKIDLLTSEIWKVFKFTQHCLHCTKKVKNNRSKKINKWKLIHFAVTLIHCVRESVLKRAFRGLCGNGPFLFSLFFSGAFTAASMAFRSSSSKSCSAAPSKSIKSDKCVSLP